ncbi:MAG: hypothetical protein HQM16_05150 [Deltaproteobacteria bacterium]|nr:hypothetical protein [Deltaproteobacteria bacterium]
MQNKATVCWDFLSEAVQMAHKLGMKIELYDSIFDEGWPLPPAKKRAVSYHNVMHQQHHSWQSDFTAKNPHFLICDKSQRRWQWGVPCLAYRQVRRHYIKHFSGLLKKHGFDGVFVCLRSQSKPPDFADLFGFNPPLVNAYKKQVANLTLMPRRKSPWGTRLNSSISRGMHPRSVDFEFPINKYGSNILREAFDKNKWHQLLGEQLTLFIRELSDCIRKENKTLGIGCPLGSRIGPPLGNMTLDWQQWTKQNLVDDLIVNQNSRQCPSMWHVLWPMIKDVGYVENYRRHKTWATITKILAQQYVPLIKHTTSKLYVATQWSLKSFDNLQKLKVPNNVAGLVFSSFRFDNPKALKRGNWRV